MNKPKKDNLLVEEQLAAFTDQILEGISEEDKISFPLDPELRALQQTALYLKNAIPKDEPSEAAILRMRQNIVMQWKQREEKKNKPFWKQLFFARKSSEQKWQSQYNRQRQSQLISLAAIVFLLFVSIFLLGKVASFQPAASGQNLNTSLFIAIGGLILLALWFFRRKR